MDQPHPAMDPAYRARKPDRVAAQRIGRRAHTRSPLGMRHHRFDVVETAGQPCRETVRQQAEGGVAFATVPATDRCSGRRLARIGAVACQRTFPVGVVRAALKACVAPRLRLTYPSPVCPVSYRSCTGPGPRGVVSPRGPTPSSSKGVSRLRHEYPDTKP